MNGCETCHSTGKWLEPDDTETLCPACGGVKCPKCGWEYVKPPCPHSNWYKCAHHECGIVFDEKGQVLTGGEHKGARRY